MKPKNKKIISIIAIIFVVLSLACYWLKNINSNKVSKTLQMQNAEIEETNTSDSTLAYTANIIPTNPNINTTVTANETGETAPTVVTLNKTTSVLDMSLVHEVDLIATIEPSTANVQTGLTWTTSNPGVARITQTTGNQTKVIGVSNGTAVITVRTENGKTATCNVTVETSPTQVILNKTNVILNMSTEEEKRQDPGSTLIDEIDLIATIMQSTANVQTGLTWTTSNPGVARITQTTGSQTKVIGVSNGTAVITARTENGKTAACNITVETSPTQLTLNKTNVLLDITEINETDLIATIGPSTANAHTRLTWTTSNPEVARVTQITESQAKVIGVSNGTAVITVRTDNGKTASCNIKVQTSPKTLTISSDKYIVKGSLITCFISYTPETTSTELIKWEIEDEDIVAITEKKGEFSIVKGLKEGETSITVKSDNGVSSTMDVTVTNLKIIPEQATIDLSVNNKITLDTERANSGEIVWKIQDESIAALNANIGNSVEITGLKHGETIVTAEERNGRTVATCKITVQTTPTEVILDKTNVVLDTSKIKESYLTAVIGPYVANVQNKLTWETSNPEVARIDVVRDEETKVLQPNKVKIVGVQNGTAVIAVRTENGKTATCNVTVETSPTEVTLDKEEIVLDTSTIKETNLTAIIGPDMANAQNKLTWKTSNPEVVKISQTTGETIKVMGVQNGTAVIIVKTENGKTASCDITVQTSPTEVTLDKEEIVLDTSTIKETELTAIIGPETANIQTGLIWTTSNADVVKLDKISGRAVKAIGVQNGTAVITVRTANGKETSCNITVQTSPTEVRLDKEEIVLDTSTKNETDLTAIIGPETANIQTGLTWTTSNADVVKLEKISGTIVKVIGVSNGTTVVTVRTENGKEEICKIRVEVKKDSNEDNNEEISWLLGDINLDKRVDVTDLLLIKRHLVTGLKKEWILTTDEKERADINQDKNVDITDLLLLKRELTK